MIIWGWKGREVQKGSGRFNCPECNVEQPYRLIGISTYFTLYFIPVFPTQHHGDYIACGACDGKFKTEVLGYQPPSRADQLAQYARSELEGGTPLQMVRTKLL